MTVENNAAPAPAAPAPVKSASDYQNDAVKQLSGTPPPAPVKAETAKPEIKPEDAPSPTIRLSLEKIAAQNKALREREDRIKPFEEISRVVDPQKLSRALASRDPLAMLEAGGFKYEDVVDRVLQNQPKGATKVEPEKDEPTGIVKELQEKLARLEKERTEEKVGKARAGLVQKGLALINAEKMPLVARLGEEAVNEAVDVLLDFAAQTGGKFPADTVEANMELALAHVEERHVKEKQRMAERYGLTSGSVTPSVKAEVEAPVQPRGEVDGQTTLSSTSLAAPASGGAAPKTDAEYQALAAAQLRKLMGV